MAHRLSSSLYDDGNKMSKGQVFLNIFSKLKNKVFLKKKYVLWDRRRCISSGPRKQASGSTGALGWQ